jgi:hypothetical protein
MSRISWKAASIGLAAICALTGASASAFPRSGLQDDVDIAKPRLVLVQGDGWGRDGAPSWDRGHRSDWERPDDAPPSWIRSRRHDACKFEDALRRAREDGLRDPYINDVTPRLVFVGGEHHGYYRQVILKNKPGCPYTDH